MKCTNCGAELPEGTVLCPKCGETTGSAPENNTPDSAEAAENSASPASPKERKSASGEKKKKSRGGKSGTGVKALFILLIFACCVVAVLLGIGIGRSIAVPLVKDTAVSTRTAGVSGADTASAAETEASSGPQITVTDTSAPTPEPTPEPTPVVTPSPISDSETAVTQFRDIRSTLREALRSYIDGPLFAVTDENASGFFTAAEEAVSSLDFIYDTAVDENGLRIRTTDGLIVTLDTDGVLAAENCAADLTGNSITETITDPAVVTADELTDNEAFAEALSPILSGSIGIRSYADPDTELSVPLGSSSDLGTLCYIVVGNTQELLSGSGCFMYSAAVYNLLWGENPLDTSADNRSERALSLPEGLTADQLYSYFSARRVLPGSLLVSSSYYVGGDTVTQTAVLLGYDGDGVTILAYRDGTAFIERCDWATFLVYFREDCYLRYVYSPSDEYAQELFPGLSSPEYSGTAGVYSPDPDTLDTPTLSFSDYTSPSVLVEGGGFGIHGIISTDAGTVTSVTVTVTDSDGKSWFSVTKTPDTAEYDLRTEVDPEVGFGTLPIGSYVYTVTATAVSGSLSVTETLLSTAFTVTSA